MIDQENERIYSERFGSKYLNAWRNRIKKVKGLLAGEQGRLLDIGCGDGEITKIISEQSKLELFGVDLSQSNVKKCLEKGIQAKACNLLTKKLPFQDNQFDVVFAGEFIEHIYETEAFLDDVKRVLKDKGKLILTIPNLGAWYNRGLLVLGYLPFWVESGSKNSFGTPHGEINGHIKAFTKKSALELLQAKGWKVVKLLGSSVDPRHETFESRAWLKSLGARVTYCIDCFCEHFPGLSSSMIIVCKKK